MQFNDYEGFIEKSTTIIEESEPGSTYALMYLDISDFKLVNDFYGYEEGDRFLHEFMNFLQKLPGTISCGRIFSDYFLRVFLTDNVVNTADMTMELETKFHRFLNKELIHHPNTTIYIVCGLCMIDQDRNLVAAIDQANIARKSAKGYKRTSLLWFNDDMLMQIRNKKRMETTILKALAEERFTFYLQPKIALHTGKIVGAEALARMIDEEGRIVLPGMFVDVMEQNESVVSLDFLMYKQVCRYLRGKLKEGSVTIPISVNMSRVHLRYKDVAMRVHNLVSAYGIPPYLLEFELTESVFLDDYSAARKVVQDLRDYGYKVAIDDFGTGYSGIRVWQDLEFDVLKLDRQFTASDINKSIKNDIIVPRFVDISHDLRIETLCEGVETLEQCQHMKNLGCSIAQGYYFSKPVPVGEFELLMQEKREGYSLPWVEKRYVEPEYIDIHKLSYEQERVISRSILHIVPGGIAGFDRTTGNILFASDSFMRMTGYTREELFSSFQIDWKGLLEFRYISGMTDEEIKHAFLKGRNFTVTCTLRTKKQVTKYIHIYGGLVTSAAWGTYCLCDFLDVTKQRLAGEQADYLDRTLTDFVNSLHGGIARVCIDDDLTILMANDGYYKMTGYTKEECSLPPTNNCGKNFIMDEDVPGFRKDLKEVIDGRRNSLMYRICKKDGTIAWIEVCVTNISHEDGKVIGEAIFLDISSDYQRYQKNKTDHLKKAEKRASGVIRPDLQMGRNSMKKFAAVLMLVIVAAGVLLVNLFTHYRNMLEAEFEHLMEENITAYIKTQRVEVRAFNEHVKGTLDTVRVAAEFDHSDISNESFKQYLNTINSKHISYDLQYASMEELKNSAEANSLKENDRYVIQRLEAGHEVISEVRYSSRFSGYFYSLAVPVIRDGVVIGILRNIINAEQLVSTSQQPSDTQNIKSYLVKSDGTIVKIRKDDEKLKATLTEELRSRGISEEPLEKIEEGISSNSQVYAGTFNSTDNNALFISSVPLGYNDWHIVDFVEERGMYDHSSVLMHQMIQASAIVLFMILFIVGMLLWYIVNQRRKESIEARKYMILAQFSDTVMFEYMYQSDTATISPNAERKFKVNYLEKPFYLKDQKNLMDLHPEDDRIFRDILLYPKQDGETHSINIRVEDQDGSYIWCAYQYQYVHDRNKVLAVIGKLTNIHEQIQREEKLLEQAQLDGLTDIYNKSAGESMIKEQIEHADKGLLFIMDVDDFKMINDEYGHIQGDRALAHIGKILKSKFRECDVVSRTGGDEFVVYMPGTDEKDIACTKAEGILRSLQEYSEENDISLSGSIGISCYPQHGSCFEELFEAADEAMYEIKKQGKNKYKISD